MAKWEGKSKGTVIGHKIFVFILNHLGLKLAYVVLRVVALYYFLFAGKSNKSIFYFYHNVLKYKKSTTRLLIYKNYYIFGQTLLDKVALMAGVKTKFTVDHEGGEVLDKIAETGKGGILISAHIGNWEIAGQLLNRLNTTFNILMYENERENIKKYMDGVQKKKNVNIIAIKDGDMGHIIELHNAFSRNELVVLHGDRFREGSKTYETDFLGKPANFPAGPFIMAAKFAVPVTFVFAVKEASTHYHFFATQPIQLKRTRTEAQTDEAAQGLLQNYVAEFEKMVHRYPEQWFNYYPFWKEQEFN
ncbi:MAG: lipid A biosynthesis acyltransferase [Bacteroidota bacterium]|nr:lipid A biosynthesis acyltransferase [Bacteroidota bacterium]